MSDELLTGIDSTAPCCVTEDETAEKIESTAESTHSLPDSDRPPLLQPTIELVVADHEQSWQLRG